MIENPLSRLKIEPEQEQDYESAPGSHGNDAASEKSTTENADRDPYDDGNGAREPTTRVDWNKSHTVSNRIAHTGSNDPAACASQSSSDNRDDPASDATPTRPVAYDNAHTATSASADGNRHDVGNNDCTPRVIDPHASNTGHHAPGVHPNDGTGDPSNGTRNPCFDNRASPDGNDTASATAPNTHNARRTTQPGACPDNATGNRDNANADIDRPSRFAYRAAIGTSPSAATSPRIDNPNDRAAAFNVRPSTGITATFHDDGVTSHSASNSRTRRANADIRS
jgi:hypothetical protein